MSNRIHWRAHISEFIVIVVGILMALWVDELREEWVNAKLEVEYLSALVIDLESDLEQFDEAEAWMRKQEAAAANVLALYQGSVPSADVAELVSAIETAGWQFSPVITRNTIEDLRSTGNLRLIRDANVRRAIAGYYTSVDNSLIPLAAMQDRIWRKYDEHVVSVLSPGERLTVLQGAESFGAGITSDVVQAAEPGGIDELIAALHAYPELEVAAREVVYQNIANRASIAGMRRSALNLQTELRNWLKSE